uniref:uncharacterized protein LOC132695160 isoform X2 n=1 Tax=Panthera onca TaxID=9690 RepID=UPI002955AB92|nr:uncharacterized protein LOC132695160 isoform X2 [Panthera onca]
MTPVNQEGGLTRHGICQHLHLRLAAPRTVRKKYLLFSPRLWCSVTAARAKTLRYPPQYFQSQQLCSFSCVSTSSASASRQPELGSICQTTDLLPESHGWRSRGAGGKLALGCTTAVCNPQRGWLGLALASPGLTLDLICSVACGQTWLSSLASCWCRSPLSPDELCHFPQFWNLTTFSGLLRPWGHRCCRTDLHPLLSQSKWNLVWVF